MTFEELRRTLEEAVAAGQVGTPVSLRIHAVLAEPQADWLALLDRILLTAGEMFANKPARLLARRDGHDRHLTVLANFQNGESSLMTIGRGVKRSDHIHLLLIGNHGLMRLEGGELFESPKEPVRTEWRSAVEASLQQGQPVAVER